MKKAILLAALSVSTIGAAAEKAPPAFWNCNFIRQVSSDHGGSQQISSERLELKAATAIEREYPEGKIHVFVCNSDPASEIDFSIADRNGNRLAISTNDANGSSAGLYSTIYLQDGSNVTLGIACSPEQQN